MATAGAAKRFCLFLWLLFAGVVELPAQVSEHMRRAQEALRAARSADAITEFTAVLATDPKNLDARANLGVLQYFAGQYGDAIGNLRIALSQKSDLIKLRALLGMAEERTGENAAAISDLEQAFPYLAEQKLKVEAGMELIELLLWPLRSREGRWSCQCAAAGKAGRSTFSTRRTVSTRSWLTKPRWRSR